jgi:Rrf2 family protein
MRLSLSLRGDYAVRAMVALATLDGQGPVSARRIADRMAIPGRFLPHVLADLSRGGLVVGRPGRGGGYRLARAATAIDLLSILDAADDRTADPRCVLRGGPCAPDGRCAVHDAVADATRAMRTSLAGTSLAELANRAAGED